jgi:hypothetical protein
MPALASVSPSSDDATAVVGESWLDWHGGPPSAAPVPLSLALPPELPLVPPPLLLPLVLPLPLPVPLPLGLPALALLPLTLPIAPLPLEPSLIVSSVPSSTGVCAPPLEPWSSPAYDASAGARLMS